MCVECVVVGWVAWRAGVYVGRDVHGWWWCVCGLDGEAPRSRWSVSVGEGWFCVVMFGYVEVHSLQAHDRHQSESSS
jgi:hypothetical protein